MSITKSPYEVLGVARTATRKQIRQRYLELCKKYHPDVAKQGERVDIRDITAAYQYLTGKTTNANTWSPPPPGRTYSPEEAQHWTKWSLLGGLGLMIAVVAYVSNDTKDDALASTFAVHQHYAQSPPPDSNTSYRQWRRQ